MAGNLGPEVLAEINRCSKCGQCREVCPVFSEMRAEPYVARAKVYLVGALREGRIGISRRFQELMEACLLCRACVSRCPNAVKVDKLVLAARAAIVDQKGLPPVKRLILRHVLPFNHRLDLLAVFLHRYWRWALISLRNDALLQRLPADLAAKAAMFPLPGRVPFRAQASPPVVEHKVRLRVAYFTGCMTNYVYHETGRALLNVLAVNRVQVVMPEQLCCGMPALAAGDRASALFIAQQNVESLLGEDVDYIVTDCASCGEMLQHYGEFLATPRAREFSRRVVDINRLLVKVVDFSRPMGAVSGTVTYHDPCHLRRGQGVAVEPREILKSIPGIELREMTEADRCCGAGGSFNLTHYRLSMGILKHKVEDIVSTGAALVATACPACRLQLSYGLVRNNVPGAVVHPVELLNQAYEARLSGTGERKGKLCSI